MDTQTRLRRAYERNEKVRKTLARCPLCGKAPKEHPTFDPRVHFVFCGGGNRDHTVAVKGRSLAHAGTRWNRMVSRTPKDP